MAKKRRKSKTTARRRRRVSGMGKLDVMEPIAAVAGAVLGGFIRNLAPVKQMLTIGGKDYSGAAVLAAGIAGKMYLKDPLMKAACNGMIVTGGVSTIQTFIPSLKIAGIMGIDQIGYIDPYVIQGNLSPARRVAGIDEIGRRQSPEPYADSVNEYAY